MSNKAIISSAVALEILQRLDIKASSVESVDGSGNYKCNSPFRLGSDSNGFSVIIESESAGTVSGAYYDHVTQSKGSLKELAEHFGIDVSKPSATRRTNTTKPSATRPSAEQVEAEPPSETYSNLADYATKHGIDVKNFRDAGWSDTTYNKVPALAITTNNGTRWRLLQGKDKYMNPKGYKPCWYKLEQALEIHKRTKKPLVLCNGEPSVVVGQAYNVPALAITASGERALPEALLQELLAVYEHNEILIALDCDDRGRTASKSLLEQLSKAGYSARALNLGLPNKGDLADYLNKHSQETLYQLPSLDFQALHEQVEQAKLEQFVGLLDGIRNLSELDKDTDIKPPEHLISAVDGSALLLKDKLYIVSGDAKLGKSTFCLHLAYCVATQAKSVLGSPDLFVKAGGRVLILDLEQELSDTVPRARAMSAISNQLDILDADTWEEQRRALEEQHDSDTHARMLIQAWCTKHKESAALVILDNLSLVQPELDFRDRDIQEKVWLTKYKRLANQYGVTIILVEHNIKANASDSAYNAVARMRGSAMKHATPNGGTFSLSYTRDKEKEKGEIQLTIEVRSAPKRLLYLKRDDTLGHHVLTISLEGLAPSEVEKATKRVHKIILDTLETHLQLSQADITNYTGLAKPTVYKALNELLKLDQVVKLQRNLWALNLKRLRINTAAALEQSQVPALEQGRDILDAVDN